MNKGIFEILGFENPGLSERLKQALKRTGGAVTDLREERISAPETGDELVQTTVIANLPDDVSLRTAEQELEKISSDLNVVHRTTFSMRRSGKNQMTATST